VLTEYLQFGNPLGTPPNSFILFNMKTGTCKKIVLRNDYKALHKADSESLLVQNNETGNVSIINIGHAIKTLKEEEGNNDSKL
jgi:hypothetical protein